MSTITNPVEYAKEAVEAYRALYGNDLISVILYGSAAGGDFDPKLSDINLLIVLTKMEVELIAKSAPLQEKHGRRRFSIPVFMDKRYIARSLDSYPIEFLDMKGCYRVLFGEDVLAGIAPEKEHLRLQVERELKGKWLHLLQEFPAARNNKRELKRLAYRSLKAYTPVFRALLMLNDAAVPSNRNELFSTVESTFSLPGTPLQQIADSCRRGAFDDLEPRFIAYTHAVRVMIDHVEQL